MKNKRKNLTSEYFKILKAVAIVVMLVLSLQIVPAMAQSNQFADVVIDGKPLFRVSSTNDKTARERAEYINGILKTVVESEKVPEIEVEEGNKYTQILIGDNSQITVTSGDVTSAENAKQQAEIWAS